MNPFIILTTTDGLTIRLNVNHIVTYDLRGFKKQYGKQVAETFTYVLMTSNCTRNVKETPEEIDELINQAVFHIPYTRTHLKGA